MSSEQPRFLLYSYFRSSCSARLRIALNLKQLPVEYQFVHLLKSEQTSPSHRALNPSCSVPVLVRLDTEDQTFPIGQSMAALEYLDDALPDTKQLLPPREKPLERAKARTLANIIACDLQPVANLRVANMVAQSGMDKVEWMKKWTALGLTAFEETAQKTAGRFCVGDSITIADICLAPAVWNAERYGVDLRQFPTVMRVYQEAIALDAFRVAHWKRQPDTPEELRDAA